MKITKAELIELKACEDGLDRFIAQTNNTDEPVEVSSLVGGEVTYSDLLWLAGEKLPRERVVRFACDCALLNIELIKPYTDKYDLILEFLRNPAGAVGAVAWYAFRDTWRLPDDAIDASAYAYTSAYAAAYAAYAYTYSFAYAAATSATAAVAVYTTTDRYAGSQDKVDELLRELFA